MSEPEGRGSPRVCHVVAAAAGGTARHAAMLAAGCAGRGLPVAVLAPAQTLRLMDSASRAFHDREDVAATGDASLTGSWNQVTRSPVEVGARPRPARDAAAVLRLRNLLAAWTPDVVHAHGLRAAALAALALASGPRRAAARTAPALLATVHNTVPQGALAGITYRVLERITARRATAVLCVSADLADRMRRAGAREVGLAVVPAPASAGPRAEDVHKARADLGAEGRPVVFAAGRLVPQKGFDALLDAAARWREREPEPLLVIAGTGPLSGQLAARSGRAGLDVAFLGQRVDVPVLLAAADVVVVPSRWEGQPLIVQETLRAGRPLVATRVGGIPALTGEDAALLVPREDPAGLAAAVASVLDDAGLAARLRAGALARAPTLPTERDAVHAALAVYRRLAPACAAGLTLPD